MLRAVRAATYRGPSVLREIRTDGGLGSVLAMASNGASELALTKRAGIVVAAGASSRMRQPKALLAWQDTTLLGYCLRELRAADVSHPIVVLGANAASILATLSESSD